MRLYRENRRSGGRTLLSAAGMAALLGIFWAAFGNVGKGADAEQFRMTEEAIRRAAVNCYAIEGSYPQNLGYLIEHYGVQVDTQKFVVTYDVVGSNLLPYIEVVRKGGRTKLDTTVWKE